MTAKSKTFALNGGHTAGIFADMTVDGPVIGTLVAVVDRAKNLPNRKTIGKQDPYCAARLGKEAKKTTTDIRGGQTPKWDQELRFTVHDSPDYYQLKMSVFTDDKKTDLIGEAWIDLKGIIVVGGGQNDMWQGLTCRGKYAGEIRVEITFYDSRPRPERPAAKQRQQAATEPDAGASLRQKTPVKRRPLPSDPVTGEAPTTPPTAVPTPQEQLRTPRSHAKSASYSAYIPTQSPLQSVEYSTPPQGARPLTSRDPYTPSPHSAHRHGHRVSESHGTPSRAQDERYGERNQASPYDHQEPRGSQASFSEFHELPDDRGIPSPFDHEAPPPPPAHRSRQSSAGPDANHHYEHYEISPQKSPMPMPMRKDVLKSEAHRHSITSYPGQPLFKAYEPSMSAPMQTASRHDSPSTQNFSRSPGYSPSYSLHLRSMQPTVEDVPDSPSASYRQDGSRVAACQDELGYYPNPGTSSQIVSRSSGASGQYHAGHSLLYDPREHPDYAALTSSVSPLSATDYSNTSSQISRNSQPSHHVRPSRHSEPELFRFHQSPGYGPPEVPPSLSPGFDVALSQEYSEGFYHDRSYDERYSAAQHATPTRGRHHSEGPPSYTDSPYTYTPQSCDGRSVVTYSSRPAQQATRARNSSSPTRNPQHAIRRKSVSPASPSAENKSLSDTPFGPDSYDAFNTSMTSLEAASTLSEKMDPNAKIIGHDGREVDLSDYLPMETWAPEPEPKGKAKQASPEPRARPSPSGAQPMPRSGRRPLRIKVRPGSMPALQQSSALPSYGQADDIRTPPPSGRNRLQKKGPRGSSVHGGHSASMSSPLLPISPENYQERLVQYTPTQGRNRGSSYDYPNENYAPHYGTGPPIPAKVPLAIMSGANGCVDSSLMEELQRIDIGNGRSRRRGGY